VAELELKLFGEPPPNGRNIGARPEIEERLLQQRIPYRKVTYHGDEVITWTAENDSAVDAVLSEQIPEEMLRGIQRMRGQEDLTTRSGGDAAGTKRP